LTSRVEELAARRKLLLARSAVQRETLRLDAAAIGDSLGLVDRAVSVVQRLRRSPVVITAAVVGLVAFRRYPIASWIMRGLAVASAARRMGVTLRRLADEPPGPAAR
jgi:hypothetical protein